MNLNRLAAAVLRALADELEPASPAAEKPAPRDPEPIGNDAPLVVETPWQPDDVEHHGLGFHQ